MLTRDWWAAQWARSLRRLAASVDAVAKARAELLTITAFVIGWALVTKGIAAFAGPVTWNFSIGLLLLSLCGWKLLYRLVSEGLYTLTQDDD